jgi:hypothetical protein
MADAEEQLDDIYGDDKVRTKPFVDQQINTFLDGHRFQVNHTAEFNLERLNKNVSSPMYANMSKYATYEDLVRSRSRTLRRGRRVRGPPQGVSGGVEDPFKGQAAVLRSLLKCKV